MRYGAPSLENLVLPTRDKNLGGNLMGRLDLPEIFEVKGVIQLPQLDELRTSDLGDREEETKEPGEDRFLTQAYKHLVYTPAFSWVISL